jgi:CheY-like chemotaxis protein
VLVCDDDILSIIAFTALLEKLGFKCSEAINGAECLDMLANYRSCECGPYKFIFIDYNMTIMSGLEVI